MKFSVLDLLLVFLLVVMLLRRGGDDKLRANYAPVPPALKLYAWIFFLGIFSQIVYGILRGGDFKSALWQFHILLWVGPMMYFFQRALRGRQDIILIAWAIFLSCYLKIILALFVYVLVAVPALASGLKPEYLTTHGDTELYVTALLMVLLFFLHKRTAVSWILTATLLPLLVTIIILNERRIAWICLIGGLVTAFALYPTSRLKAQLVKVMTVMGPILVGYVAVGANIKSGPFKPAAKSASLFEKNDASTYYGDYENYNLIDTFKPNPVLGSGFGHEFVESIKLDDISQFFALMKYIPHNSVLWLLSIGGIIGFVIIWLHMPVGVYFAARTIRAPASWPLDRAACMVCISVVITRMLLLFGDMGATRWLGWTLYAVASTMAGKLAVQSDAWPMPGAERLQANARR